jgi:hypothetical protein
VRRSRHLIDDSRLGDRYLTIYGDDTVSALLKMLKYIAFWLPSRDSLYRFPRYNGFVEGIPESGKLHELWSCPLLFHRFIDWLNVA